MKIVCITNLTKILKTTSVLPTWMKIYGRLDCPSALSTIRRFPGSYEKHRVFFADEKTALAAGYRPCGNCLRAKYKEYMADADAYKKKFGL